MRIIACLIVINFFGTEAIAQNRMPVEDSGPIGKKNDINLSAGFPMGETGKYYSLAAGFDYDRTFFTLGEIKRGKSYDYQSMRINASAGLDMFFGKTRMIGSVNYKTDNISVFHLFPEFEYDPCERDEITLGGGPAYGFGNGQGEFGFGVNLYNTYFFDPQGDRVSRKGSIRERFYGVGLGLEWYKLGSGDPYVLIGGRLVMAF